MGEREAGEEEMPKWLKTLLDDKSFFTPCWSREHDGERENILCVDCGSRLCPRCSPPHLSHRLLQIWRHGEHNSVQVEVFCKLFDLTSIMVKRTGYFSQVILLPNLVLCQFHARCVRHVSGTVCPLTLAYGNNRTKVVLIHPSRPSKKKIKRQLCKQCSTCGRNMRKDDKSIIKDLNSSSSTCEKEEEEDVYCSLACKAKKLCKEEGELMQHLKECAPLLPLPVSCLSPECQLNLELVHGTATSMPESTSSGAGRLGAAGEGGLVVKKPRLGRACGDD